MMKKKPDIGWTLTIDGGVGPFRFDLPQDEVKSLIKDYRLIKIDDEGRWEVIDWDTYEIPEFESRVHIGSDGRTDDISCLDELIFKGRSLIGMTRDEFVSFLGEESEVDELCVNFSPAYYMNWVFPFIMTNRGSLRT